MRGFMFRSRWFALLFVAMVLAAVTRIVGTEEGGGAIAAAQGQFADRQQNAQALADREEPPQDIQPSADAAAEEIVLEFTPDEELIDPATGYDPTPTSEFAPSHVIGEEVADETQGAILLQNGGTETGQ